MTKKIFSAVVALALAFTVIAPAVTSAQTVTTTSAYTFSTDLTVGSTGSDVVALQSFLVAKGLLTMPAGVAEGYFGSLTQAAVSAYQAMKGITPTAGYFGPITRAAVNADEMSMGGTTTTTTTTTCPAGYTCTSTTPVNTAPVCPAGYTCTANPGTVTTSAPAGTEGTLQVTLASNPADQSNIRTQTDIPVYGLNFLAQIAPVTVQTVDLEIADYNTTNGSNENPATLINTIKVWNGSTLIETVPVTASSFTQDSNQNYYIRFSGLNFLVPVGTTQELTFSFSTNSIDVQRNVTINGYGSSSIRATSGDNISDFYDASGLVRHDSFYQPGTATLTLSAASNPLREQNYRIDPTNGVLGVPLLTFNLNAQTGNASLLTVNASTTASGTKPTTLYLYNGSTLLQSQSVGANGSAIFNNLNNTTGAVVSADTIQTFTIKADYPSNTANGSYSSTTINSIVYETANGSTLTTTSSPVVGVNQYFYTASPSFTLASTPTIQITGTNQNGSSTAATATFSFNVTATGGTMTEPVNSDFVVDFATSTTGVQLQAPSVSVVTIPNNNIADGSTASVTVTAQLPNSTVVNSGLYNAYIKSITWHITNNTASPVTQSYGLEDYQTQSAANFIK